MAKSFRDLYPAVEYLSDWEEKCNSCVKHPRLARMFRKYDDIRCGEIGMSGEIACQGYEAMTNADKIRSMTDEEMAELLIDLQNLGCSIMGKWHKGMCAKSCEECWFDWLQQEVSDGR